MTAEDTVGEREELITPDSAEALAGLLDIAAPRHGDPLPPLWHWVYLLERRRQSELGPDGHPLRGIPTPPEPGQSRMFAGGRVRTLAGLRFGEPATRTIRVIRSAHKEGRSGPLTFVTTRAEIRQSGVLAIVEEQDIVYRSAQGSARTSNALAAPDAEAASAPALLELDVDPVVLFRFSALTYNSHRIHYDQAYAESEGYPDLVVHGPLQALLMGEALRRAGVPLQGREFSYRLIAPTFGSQRLRVIAGPDGTPETTRVCDGHGVITATAELRGTPDPDGV